MMFGACEKCGGKIALINTIVLDKDIDNTCEDDMIIDFEKAKYYAITLNNLCIGKAIIYKNATINKKIVLGLQNNINRNVARVSLECLSENEEMNIENLGICNGHFENER